MSQFLSSTLYPAAVGLPDTLAPQVESQKREKYSALSVVSVAVEMCGTIGQQANVFSLHPCTNALHCNRLHTQDIPVHATPFVGRYLRRRLVRR